MGVGNGPATWMYSTCSGLAMQHWQQECRTRVDCILQCSVVVVPPCGRYVVLLLSLMGCRIGCIQIST